MSAFTLIPTFAYELIPTTNQELLLLDQELQELYK